MLSVYVKMITQLAGVCSAKCLRYSTCSYVTLRTKHMWYQVVLLVFLTHFHYIIEWNLTFKSYSRHSPSQSQSAQPVTVAVGTARHSRSRHSPSQSQSVQPVTVAVRTARHNQTPISVYYETSCKTCSKLKIHNSIQFCTLLIIQLICTD